AGRRTDCCARTTRRSSGASPNGASIHMTDLAGRVLHRGRGQAGCQVLAVDEAAGAVLADAETSIDGIWELTAPGAPGERLVFARCRGEALGVVAAPIRPDDQRPVVLEMTDVARTHELTVRIDQAELPGWMRPQVRLSPRRIDGLEARLLRWVHAPV